MTPPILDRLRALLGPAQVARDPGGLPRATPDSTETMATVCRLAHEEGWRVRIEGHGSWLQADAPADLAISTRALDQVPAIAPSDLVATVQAGTSMETLRRRLADQRMWLALDPPGRPERTLGSVLATATAGPLRNGSGPVRDHVLGCTVVTGDGRVVRAGGRVVKNVAGYDLTKLQVGGFGGFGIITEAHVRLRAVPRADQTLAARGQRDTLTSVARDLVGEGFAPAAFELLSPAAAAESEWMLAVRLLGPDEAVEADARRLPSAGGLAWEPVPVERSAAFWGMCARSALAGPVTFRLGVLTEGVDDTIDLVAHDLDEGIITAGAGQAGMLRWTGDASPERLRHLRRSLAAREIPLTIERAPWAVRQAVGHFGAYREGVSPLVDRLRETFDPGRRIQVALEQQL
jgi:FAD/FMN-containing dehydrogenase